MNISKTFCPVVSAVFSTCEKVNGDKKRLLDTETGFGRGGFQLCYNLGPERGSQHWHREKGGGGQQMDRNSIFKATSRCSDTD